jgi:hypothetical protein
MGTERERHAGFEWRSEEEGVITAPSAPVGDRAHVWRRLRLRVALLAAVLLLGLVVYRYLERQAGEATAESRQEVLAAYRLLHRAASQGDGELVNTLLLAHDGGWRRSQQELFEDGLFFDRSGLGWAASGSPEVTAVHLSADLQQAEVVFEQPYTITRSGGTEATALFQHAAVYRRQGDQWLLAPPPAEFWGPWRGSRQPRLNLIFPERDTAVAERLAADLDVLIETMCGILAGLNCPADLQVQVRLERQPVQLSRLLENEAHLSAGQRIELPALSLIGMPLSETAYQVVYQAYAVRVAAAVIAGQVAWECCERVPFSPAMLDKQLYQLGLRPWPVHETHYRYLAQSPPRLLHLGRYWHRSMPTAADLEDGWLIYALIDFAEHAAPELSLAGRQRLLSRSGDYMEWLRQALDSNDDTADLWRLLVQWDRQWLLFAHSRLDQPPGTAWPEQPIALACRPGDNDSYGLFLYLLAPGSGRLLPAPVPSLETVSRGGSQPGLPLHRLDVLPLPGQRGALLQLERRSEAGRHLELFAWMGAHLKTLFDTTALGPEAEGRLFHVDIAVDPTAELLLFRDLPSALGEFAFWLFDTAACRRGACDFQRLKGRPAWSPDGMRTVLVSDVTRADSAQSVPLLLADRWGANAVPLAEGYAPFWLDAETAGYFQRRPVPALFTVRLSGGEGDRPGFTTDSFPISPGTVRQVVVHPVDPQRLFFLLEARQRTVVSFHLDTGERLSYQPAATLDERELSHLPAASLRIDLARCPDQNCWRTESFSLSPDGRWLVTVNSRFEDALNSSWFVFHDLGQESPVRLIEAPISVTDAATGGENWSADGRWFLLPDPDVLRLYSPSADAFHYRLLEKSCFFAGWQAPQP